MDTWHLAPMVWELNNHSSFLQSNSDTLLFTSSSRCKIAFHSKFKMDTVILTNREITRTKHLNVTSSAFTMPDGIEWMHGNNLITIQHFVHQMEGDRVDNGYCNKRMHSQY